MFLESLGADTALRKTFQPFAARGLHLARVAVSHRDRYGLLTEEAELAGEPSGALWHRTPEHTGMPVTGDWVGARIIDASLALVEEVLPRRTLFSRRSAGHCEIEQPIAANLDLIFIVCGLDADFNPRRLERYLALARESQIDPVVILNKSDLCPKAESRSRETAAIARGAPVVITSTVIPDGLIPLRPFLGAGRTVALVGSSGVGKSAIVNRLLGSERLRTGAVRESDGRGRHTSTRRELFPLPAGGALIDTPGMREIQLWAGEDSVERVFDEIVSIASHCRFRDCSHQGEPDCAVARAIAQGGLNEERLKSYRKLIAEARRHEELIDPRAAARRKKAIKVLHKQMRSFSREPEW